MVIVVIQAIIKMTVITTHTDAVMKMKNVMILNIMQKDSVIKKENIIQEKKKYFSKKYLKIITKEIIIKGNI